MHQTFFFFTFSVILSITFFIETVREQLKVSAEEGSEVLHLITVAIPAFRDNQEIQMAAADALVLLLKDGKFVI